jgi:hypothetical protein
MPNEDVWVESIVAQFGNRTLKGLIDFLLLRQGALINKKCPYILIPLLQCPDVVEGVGYDKLQNFRYYV